MIKSKALEVNLLNYHVEVPIQGKYCYIQEVISQYPGLVDSASVVLRELGHPYKNWQFIIDEIIGIALDYFHLFKNHEQGVLASKTIVGIFIEAIESDVTDEIRSDAADNLIRYLNYIVSESDFFFSKFISVVDETFDWIKSSKDGYFCFFTRSFYSIRKLAKALLDYDHKFSLNYITYVEVIYRYLHSTYSCWLNVKDPLEWLEESVDDLVDRGNISLLLNDISHKYILECLERLVSYEESIFVSKNNSKEVLIRLLELPDYVDFVKSYKNIPELVASNVMGLNGNKWKILFLFHSMSIPELSSIYEDLLVDMNRTVSWLIVNQGYDYINRLINKTFFALKNGASQFPQATFSCIMSMGRGVYKTNNLELVELFVSKVVDLGFQVPGTCDVGDDWQIRNNKAHIKNIRTWLRLIRLKPKWSKKLISSLIINLSVSGVLIKDTDVFPRDITHFLNSEISPVYNLVKQLCRLFPAYFSDIGAEGSLRDISTRLDEITCRQDVLIHFLRKQSHVESSNRIIAFIEAVIKFWETKNKELLVSFVPPLIFSQIENEGLYINGVNRLLSYLKREGLAIPGDLLFGVNNDLYEKASRIKGVSKTDIDRVSLIISFYKLLHDKYNLDFRTIQYHLKRLELENFPKLFRLTKAFKKERVQDKISYLLEFLTELKLNIISENTYETKSEIYKKRHFAIDIPSTYGSYYELKFASLGLSFRIESFVNVLFEELNQSINLDLITKATFSQIYDCLKLFYNALKIDGIYSVEFERQLDFLSHSLEVKEFTFTQYMDVFKGFIQAVKNITNDYFYNVHGQNLTKVLSTLDRNFILPKYFPGRIISDEGNASHRISEIFFRDRIAMSLGLQQLDVLLSKIHSTIFEQSSRLPKGNLKLLLNYNPKCAVNSLDATDSKASGIIYMGSKGDNMHKLYGLGLPTPPCFIVTTEAFRCRNLINSFAPAKNNFIDQINFHIKKLENITGKRLGSLSNSMLLSVRSGSSVSQPGMMDTLVNVGVNQKIIEAIAREKGNPWFAWDSYRRFLGCYGTAFGLDRGDFDDIVSEFKKLFNVNHKKGFTWSQMKAVALAYKNYIEKQSISIPDDPFEQLYNAINAVFDSWESEKARAYRSIMGISDDWGTAVVIQDMVFGNISKNSGSGVFFTHNPRWSGDSLNLWGDFTIGGQGEDVVSGLVKTFPISVKQQEAELKDTDITLETHFPEIYKTIKDWANILVYKKGWGPQEMEFTFEDSCSEDLYLLQTRDMSIRERSYVLKFIQSKIQTNIEYLGSGIGVSGGAMSGRVVFTQRDIKYWRNKEPESSLILLRRDTVPDDIREIFSADGLLTVKGGVTSHASVVAHRLGKTCVVGCENLVCNEKDKIGIIGDKTIRSGDCISIDGRDGSVFKGKRTIDMS